MWVADACHTDPDQMLARCLIMYIVPLSVHVYYVHIYMYMYSVTLYKHYTALCMHTHLFVPCSITTIAGQVRAWPGEE